MGKNLKYQTKEELLATAKAMGVKGLNKTMAKSEMISRIESTKQPETKQTKGRARGEY